MEVNNTLKKQIITEIFLLILLAMVVIYAFTVIQKNNKTSVYTQDGFVVSIDDSKIKKLEVLSDGQGLETDYVRYTLTNNNETVKSCKLIVKPSSKDKKTLEHVRIGLNDLFVMNVAELEKYNDGYIVDEFEISPGYTRNYLFKYWYDSDTKEDISKKNITFEYEFILEEI